MPQDQIKTELLNYLSGDNVPQRTRQKISRNNVIFSANEMCTNPGFDGTYATLNNNLLINDIISDIIANPNHLFWNENMLAARKDMTIALYMQYKSQIDFDINMLQENQAISIDDVFLNLTPEQFVWSILIKKPNFTRNMMLDNLGNMDWESIINNNPNLLDPEYSIDPL